MIFYVPAMILSAYVDTLTLATNRLRLALAAAQEPEPTLIMLEDRDRLNEPSTV
jgi:hypothetical protein